MPERMHPSFDGTKLFVRRDIPDMPKAIVLIVHGLCEHQGRYDDMVRALNDTGIGVYRFDHRGHGRSEGERTYFASWDEPIDDTNAVLDLAIEQNPDLPIFLIGHSMGGYAVAGHGLKYPGRVDGVVASGAVVYDPLRFFANMPSGQDPHTRLPNELGEGVCSVKAVRDAYAADDHNSPTFTVGLCYAIRDGLAHIAENIGSYREPILLLHGEKDSLVSPRDSMTMFENISSEDRQLKIYGNLFHEIFNEYARDEVIQDVNRWILNRAYAKHLL